MTTALKVTKVTITATIIRCDGTRQELTLVDRTAP